MSIELPTYWRNESGLLQRAILTYMSEQTGGGVRCNTEDIRMIREYLQRYVNNPCWTESIRQYDPGSAPEFVQLRADVLKLTTTDEIHAWLMRALDFVIDPL